MNNQLVKGISLKFMKITGKKINKIIGIDAKHVLYREDGKWYHHLENFPGVLFDINGYLLFENKRDYISHPNLRHTQDLNVEGGISNVTGYKKFSNSELIKVKSAFGLK
jgi:hypothetical protein